MGIDSTNGNVVTLTRLKPVETLYVAVLDDFSFPMFYLLYYQI